MKFVTAVAASALALAMGGCATVTRGTSDAWVVNTTPPGARVETTNGHQCPSTPCAIKMSRKSEFTATISKAGYKSATVSVTNKIGTGGGAGMAGNVLVGGLIGAGVDVATGAMKELTPNPVNVTLELEAAAAPTQVSAPVAPQSAPTNGSVVPAAIAAPAQPSPAAKECGMVRQPNGSVLMVPCT